MTQPWIVEHTDDDGLMDICEYEHYGDAKDVADQKWEEYKGQPGLAVKVYHQPNASAPRELVYTAGQP